MTGHRTFQLLLCVAALGAAIAAFRATPRAAPSDAAAPSRHLRAHHAALRDVATLPAVYVDAAPIVITARGIRAATPTVHMEVTPIVVRGRKPPPVKPAARLAKQPCATDTEGC